MSFYELWVGEAGHTLVKRGGQVIFTGEDFMVLKEVFWAKNWAWANAHVNDVLNLSPYVPEGWQNAYGDALCSMHKRHTIRPELFKDLNAPGFNCSHCVYDSIKDE